MANSLVVSRAHIAYALCLPVAVLLGYLLADPTQSSSLAVVLVVLAVLSIPLLIRWHHTLLVFGWNAAIYLAFVRGQPSLWVLLAFISFGMAIVSRATNPDARFVTVPSISYSLLFLTVTVCATALMAGGMGMRAMGSSNFGGKSYLLICAAIVGYFAFASQRIPAHRARLYVSIFFLAGLTSVIPNLLYAAGARASFLYYFFPAGLAVEQVQADYSLGALGADFVRYDGLSGTAASLALWLLAMYGLGRLFDWKRPLRLLLFLGAAVGILFGGFRSTLVCFLLTVGALFCCEGLFRWRTVAINLGVALVAVVILLPNTDRLPVVVQRTISFLPVNISLEARTSAEHSSEWRLDMWKDLLPEVPKYLLKGKGCGIDPGEMLFADINEARGYAKPYYWAILTGTYHNGPLSVVIPFGIWGVIALVWFWIASLRYLYRNFRDGDPALREINTFMLAYFIARMLMFVLVVGAISVDLVFFTGLVGLSVSLNGSEPYVPEEAPEEFAEHLNHEELETAGAQSSSSAR